MKKFYGLFANSALLRLGITLEETDSLHSKSILCVILHSLSFVYSWQCVPTIDPLSALLCVKNDSL